MSGLALGVLLISVMLILLAFGIPVAFSMGLSCIFFLIVTGVMFDGRSDAVLSLHTACESCCDDSDQNFD